MFYRPEHNVKGPHGTEFWRSANAEMKYTTGIARSRSKKWVQKRKNCYHIYFWCYGHYNVKNGSFFAFSADDSKKSVTIWGKYFSESERPCLVLSFIDIFLIFLTSNISQTVTPKPISYTIFWTNLIIFQAHWKILPKLWLNFCHQQQI